jgi:erythromycin esterase-like protein
MFPIDPPPAAAVAWVREHAIPLHSCVAGTRRDDLEPLRRVVGDARIVALGEPTHGTREAFQMKHRLLEFLVEQMDFSLFGIEANLPESFALNDYVVRGVGDPKALIAGMYFWTWNTEEVLAMVEWMRARNVAHPERPLLFTGFDMQVPDVAIGIVKHLVRQHAPELVPDTSVLDRVKKVRPDRHAEANFTSATGTFPVAAARGKRLCFSAAIRTEGVDGFAGLWWRCDRAGGMGAFNNMHEQQIAGSRDWQRYELALDVDPDTTNINFGCLMSGNGQVWFDDLEVTLDGVPFVDPALPLTFDGEQPPFFACYEHSGYRIEMSPRTDTGGHCLSIHRRVPPPPAVGHERASRVRTDLRRLGKAIDRRRHTLTAAVGTEAFAFARRNLRVLEQYVEMRQSEREFAARDAAMAENVGWILAQHPGRKIVLWAHNGHVGRDPKPSQQMGAFLEAACRGQMVVFGFATGEGHYTAVDRKRRRLTSDNPLLPPPPDSIEAILGAAGPDQLLVDLRAARRDDAATGWARASRAMRSIGAIVASEQQFIPCIAAAEYDVLVWQRRTSASVPLRS